MRTNLTESKPLFNDYSKKKLYCLAHTYEELARLYRESRDMDRLFAADSIPDRRDMLFRREMNETKQVFASYLEEISEAFTDVADTVVQVSRPFEHKKRALVHYLKKQGILVREIVFIEGRQSSRISLEARIAGRHEMYADELAGMLSVYFNRRLIPSLESAGMLVRGYRLFVFEDEPRYAVLSAVSRAIKEDEKISGDNFSIEEYNQNQVVAMIADGMGSGEQACRDSRCVIEFMERLLEAGFSRESALSMANGVLISQNPFGRLTTLDLCSINLLNGEAEFVKAGAASSFIKHGRTVEELALDTLPLGSVEEPGAMQLSIQLYDADMIVMVSDGVADAFAELGAEALKDVIARTVFINPKEFSEYLLHCAINCQGGHIRDDMTVLAMYVNRND